jgi:hypothetical protein
MHISMPTKARITPIQVDDISRAIAIVRGHNVLLDAELASLYGVATKVLIQAVKRNLFRWVADSTTAFW